MPYQIVSNGKTYYLLFSNTKSNDSINSKFILRIENSGIKKIIIIKQKNVLLVKYQKTFF